MCQVRDIIEDTLKLNDIKFNSGDIVNFISDEDNLNFVKISYFIESYL